MAAARTAAATAVIIREGSAVHRTVAAPITVRMVATGGTAKRASPRRCLGKKVARRADGDTATGSRLLLTGTCQVAGALARHGGRQPSGLCRGWFNPPHWWTDQRELFSGAFHDHAIVRQHPFSQYARRGVEFDGGGFIRGGF
jgi:hypothetical protein